MEENELKEKLKNHKKWLKSEAGGERADLRSANLRSADLSYADLSSADLHSANLRYANLHSANLSYADLHSADIRKAHIDLLTVLQINMGGLSNKLTLELMRWDSLICGKDKMQEWAEGGDCPFSTGINRLFNFSESKGLWRAGKPKLNIMELWQAVANELDIKI